MKKGRKLYLKLFASTFTISAFTFGGGYVIVPLMRKRFVEEYGWIGEEEMLDLVAIAQSSPGPIAINTSMLVGYRMAGIPGALCTVFGTVLPPLVIITVISLFYEAFRQNATVSAAMQGMQAGVAAVIADATLTMGKNVLKPKKGRALSLAVMTCAFVAAYFLKINVGIIVLTCAAVGAATVLLKAEKKGEGEEKKA